MPQGAAFGAAANRARSTIGGGGGGTSSNGRGPGASMAAAKANATPAPLSANPNNPRTQNVMRSAANYTGPGATPFIADPSIGQIVGAVSSLVPGMGTMNNIMGGIKGLIDNNGNFGSTFTGGAIGSGIDHLLGGTPGPVTGASNPDANASMHMAQNGAPSLGASMIPMPKPIAPLNPMPSTVAPQLSALALQRQQQFGQTMVPRMTA